VRNKNFRALLEWKLNNTSSTITAQILAWDKTTRSAASLIDKDPHSVIRAVKTWSIKTRESDEN